MRKSLIVFALLLLLPSLSLGWDDMMSTQMRIYHDYQQQQRRDMEAIGNNLGQIWAQQAQRRVEQDAMEFFKDGVTPEKVQAFSQRYPNAPLAWIYDIAARIQRVQDAAPRRQLQSESAATYEKMAESLKPWIEEERERQKNMSPEESKRAQDQAEKKWKEFIDNYYGIGR